MVMRSSRERRAALTALAVAGSLVVWSEGAPPLAVRAAGTAWTTDHLDAARSGNDISDTELAGTPVTAWTSPTVDGRIYGEPLYLNNSVYVATQRNSIYAFDALDGHLLWSLLTIVPSVPLSEVHTEVSPASCGNIDPMGIIGTPVIDPGLGTAGTLFAVAETYSGVANSNSIEHRLLKVDLATHALTGNRNIDASSATSGATRGLEQERGALALAAGEVVVPYGGLAGDCGPYHGFAVSALEDLSGSANTFTVDPGNTRGGIWAASGASVDASGNVYVATGNGSEPSGNYDLSDGVIKLPPTMGQPADTAHYFAPTVWFADNSGDKDLGSVTPILIPRPGPMTPLIFTTGKQNMGFLLDSANLGGIGGQLFPSVATQGSAGHVCDQDARGGNAYAGGMLYVPCLEGLRALTVNTSTPSFTRAWIGPSDANGPPILAGGRVWVHGSNRLYGLNASTGAVEVTLLVSTPYNFGSPSAGGGSLFYPAGTSVVSFRVGPTNNVVAAEAPDHSVWVNRGGSGWASLGGVSVAAPAVVSVLNGAHGSAYYIVTGQDHDLWFRGDATPWQRLNTNGIVGCLDNPAAAIVGGILWVACEGQDKALWAGHATVSGTQLPLLDRTMWQNLGGILVAGPAVASVGGNTTFIVDGADGLVYTRTLSTGYSATPWMCSGHPAATSSGAISYFACQGSGDRQLYYASNSGSGWSASQSLGGLVVDGPGIVAGPSGAAVYVEGQDRAVYHRTTSNGWSPDGGVVVHGVGAAFVP
jgi:hypothetical protein